MDADQENFAHYKPVYDLLSKIFPPELIGRSHRPSGHPGNEPWPPYALLLMGADAPEDGLTTLRRVLTYVSGKDFAIKTVPQTENTNPMGLPTSLMSVQIPMQFWDDPNTMPRLQEFIAGMEIKDRLSQGQDAATFHVDPDEIATAMSECTGRRWKITSVTNQFEGKTYEQLRIQTDMPVENPEAAAAYIKGRLGIKNVFAIKPPEGAINTNMPQTLFVPANMITREQLDKIKQSYLDTASDTLRKLPIPSKGKTGS